MFGETLRKQRQMSDLTIDDVVKGMSWSKSYLMDCERNRISPPTIPKLLKISSLLNTNFQELLKSAFQEKRKITIELPKENEQDYLNVASAFIMLWENGEIQKLKQQLIHN